MTVEQVCQHLGALLAGRRTVEVAVDRLRCKVPKWSARVVLGRRSRAVRQAHVATSETEAIRGLVRQLVQEPAIPLTSEQSERLRQLDLELSGEV